MKTAIRTALPWLGVLLVVGCSRATPTVTPPLSESVAESPPLIAAIPTRAEERAETATAVPPAAGTAPVTFVSFPLEIEHWEIPFRFAPRISLRATEERAERLAPAPLKDSQLKFGPRFAAPDLGAPSRVEPVFDPPELSRIEPPRPAPPAFPGGGRSRVVVPRGSDPAPIVANPPPLAEKMTPAKDPAAAPARGVTNVAASVGRDGPVPPQPSAAVVRSGGLETVPPEIEAPASANLPRIKLP